MSELMVTPLLSGDKTKTGRLISLPPNFTRLMLSGIRFRYGGTGGAGRTYDEHYAEEIDEQGEGIGRYHSIGRAPWQVNDLL